MNFLNPFPIHGCVPCAFGNAAGMTSEQLLALGKAAQRTPRRLGSRQRLMTRTYRAFMSNDIDATLWATLAGLRIVESVRFELLIPRGFYAVSPDGRMGTNKAPYRPRPRVSRFVSEHRKGTWIVAVYGHALLVVDGETFNNSNSRSIVQCAYRVVPLKGLVDVASVIEEKV